MAGYVSTLGKMASKGRQMGDSARPGVRDACKHKYQDCNLKLSMQLTGTMTSVLQTAPNVWDQSTNLTITPCLAAISCKPPSAMSCFFRKELVATSHIMYRTHFVVLLPQPHMLQVMSALCLVYTSIVLFRHRWASLPIHATMPQRPAGSTDIVFSILNTRAANL
jgi:hypothetical protein